MKKPLKILLKIGYWFLLVVLALLVGFGIYSTNASAFGKNKLPMPFGYGAAVVLSGSMEEALSVDDLVIVHEEETYFLNDVVVYQSGNSLVVHRIISIDGTTVITQGDANNTPDEPIDLSRIKGKVVFAIPYVGTVFDIIRSPIGTLVIIGLAILLLWAAGRADRKEDEKEKEAILEEIRRLKHAAASSEVPSESEVEAHDGKE